MLAKNRTAIVVGDSCAAGIGAPQKFGWAQRLERHFHGRTAEVLDRKPCFYNLAVPGESVGSLLLAVERGEVERRHREPTLTVVALGGHQPSVDMHETGRPQLGKYADRMGALATGLYKYGGILYVGIAAPNTERLKGFSPMLAGWSVPEIEDLVLQYEQVAAKAILEACPASRQAAAVPLFETTRAAYRIGSYATAADAIHPNGLGHQFVFASVQGLFDDMMVRMTTGE